MQVCLKLSEQYISRSHIQRSRLFVLINDCVTGRATRQIIGFQFVLLYSDAFFLRYSCHRHGFISLPTLWAPQPVPVCKYKAWRNFGAERCRKALERATAIRKRNNVESGQRKVSHSDGKRHIQEWTCNAPQGVQYGVSAFTETVDGKQFYRIMLFGGRSPMYATWMRTTWIYYDEVNSWRTVDIPSERPPGAGAVSLTTVCNDYVILLLHLN